MKRIIPAGIALLSLLLSATTQAAPGSFTNYGDFYRSLGGSLFQGSGTDMAMPCTDAPRNCVWVTSMGQALRRFDQTLWSGPGDLAMTAPAGVPEVAFDGEALVVGTQRWPLSRAINLAPAPWNDNAPIAAENVAVMTLWHRGSSVCLDIRQVSSGKGDRYTKVVLLHEKQLYVLPPLFGTCAAVREAPHQGFSYPSNSYLGAGMETDPEGLQVDYLLSDGITRIARYRLRFPDHDDPFVFEAMRE